MDLSKARVIKNCPFKAVVALVAIQAIINFIWLKKDNFPLWFDFGGYFKRSIEIFYASQTNFLGFAKSILGIGEYAHAYNPHRLILPLFSLPWYYIWGVTTDVAVMSCTTFLAIALFSTYRIASRMFDKTTGLLAAFILSVSPGFFTFYRKYSVELASTAMVALSGYFLFRSQNFQNKKYSILSGMAFGLSMITKEMSFAFIPGIVIYALYKAIKERKEWFLNSVSFVLTSVIIIFLFYWLHRQEIVSGIFEAAYSEEMRKIFGMPYRFSIAGITFYLKDMINFSLLKFCFLFFILGIFLCLREKADIKGFLFSWLITSYVLLISTQTKASYYAMPLLIPVSIIASFSINKVFKSKAKRITLISVTVIWGIFELLVYSFPVFASSHWRILNPDGYGNYLYPRNEDWKLDEILDYVKENLAHSNTLRIHVGANLHPFSHMTLAYVATQKKMKSEFAGYRLKTEEALSCDFVIVKSGQNQGMFYSAMQAEELIQALDKNEFVRLPETFTLSDNSIVTIYKKKQFP